MRSRPRTSLSSSVVERDCGPDLELEILGGLLADRRRMDPLQVILDRVVEVIAADPKGFRDDDPAECDHGHLARSAANVDDHVAGGLRDRQLRADRGRDRLLDQVYLAGAGSEAGLLDRPLLDLGDARGAHITTRERGYGRGRTLRMKWRSIRSVTSKSAMTPCLSGRIAEIVAGVRPIIRRAASPTEWTVPVCVSIATTEGSLSAIPRPRS